MNIIVIEDNNRLSSILKQGLVEDGHQVMLCHRGDEGRDILLNSVFDVAVLDVMLPGLDGFTVLQQIRKQNCHTPVLMLTARDTMPDIVHGLNLGADDYLTKPFQLQVFIARIRAVGRRFPSIRASTLTVGDLVLDTSSRILNRGDEQIALSRKEYAILELLMRRANHVVTRNQVREVAWPFDADVSDSSVDFHMHSLRSKVDVKGSDRLIKTVRCVGYKMTGRK